MPQTLPTAVYKQDLRRRVSQGRIYVWPPTPQGIAYPSVTTILQALPKEALMFWAAKLVAETAVESYELLGKLIDNDSDKAIGWLKGAPWGKRDKAGLYGTTLHDLCEAWIIGDDVTSQHIVRTLTNPGVKKKADQLRHAIDTLNIEWVGTERVVFDRDKGYAGTVDLFGTVLSEELCARMGLVPPQSMIFDIKTGKGVYPETALQLAAYRFAPEMVDHINGGLVPTTPTNAAAVIHITETSWAIMPVAADEQALAIFDAATAVAKHLPLDPGLVGLPVVRGSR